MGPSYRRLVANSLLEQPWRLDYTIADEPVSLTAAVQALRGLGVTVGTWDVCPDAAGRALVVGTVSLPPWLDVPAVEHALLCAGATEVRAVPVDRATQDCPATAARH